MTHIIQKQILELMLDEGPHREELQEDMVRRFQEKTVPAISALFDRLAPPHTIFKVDRLELDLGAIKPENLEQELLRQLEKMLQQHFEKSQSFDKNGLEIISSRQGLFQQFLHFLKFGHFSWNANGITPAQMEKELPEAFKKLGAEDRDRLWGALSSKQTVTRLQAQFSKELIKHLARQLLPFEGLEFWGKALHDSFPRNPKPPFYPLALATFAHGQDSSAIGFLNRWLSAIEREWKLTEKERLQFRESLLAKAESESSTWSKTLKKAVTPPDPTGAGILAAQEDNLEIEEVQTSENGGTIYIKNAGLVLFWPYLQRFFANLNLAKENEFSNRKAWEKAACILQFLVEPETDITENLLPLNKILCGLDVPEVISSAEIKINAEDEMACRELIKAVIENWGKLGKTSVEGFQTSFLQREGRLEKTDSGWNLKVEQRSFDMLLDSLPWDITLIKLPWMPKPLHVEW